MAFLLIHGSLSNSRLWTPILGALPGEFPDFQIATVPGGHMGLLTHPAAIADVWRRWLVGP